MEHDDRAPYLMFPVIWPEADTRNVLRLDDLLLFVTGHDAPHDMASISQRYRSISAHESEVLYQVPREPRIMNKVVWPFREAKAAFVLGN